MLTKVLCALWVSGDDPPWLDIHSSRSKVGLKD